MKCKLNLLLIALLSAGLLLLSNCKDKNSDNNTPKPDPCAGKKIPLGDIMLAEKPDLYVDTFKKIQEYFETDKINYLSTLQMRGPAGYKTYRWDIGTMQNYSTQQNAVINFTKAEGVLTVRLIGTRYLMTDCFPNDDGVDTLEKTIEVIENWNGNEWNSPITGTWKGTSTQFKDTVYEISFLNEGTSTAKNLTLVNLLKNGCEADGDFTLPGNIVWTGFGDKTNCNFDFVAHTFLNNKDSIVVNYRVNGPPPAYKISYYTFTGKRK